MESSIAEFRMRQSACELLPTMCDLVVHAPATTTSSHAHVHSVVNTHCVVTPLDMQCGTSQRSLQDAPIFRLLLKVAVKGTHQCDFLNF